jgi:hypothetical protein
MIYQTLETSFDVESSSKQALFGLLTVSLRLAICPLGIILPGRDRHKALSAK